MFGLPLAWFLVGQGGTSRAENLIRHVVAVPIGVGFFTETGESTAEFEKTSAGIMIRLDRDQVSVTILADHDEFLSYWIPRRGAGTIG